MKKTTIIILLIFLNISSYANGLSQKWWFTDINTKDNKISLEKTVFNNNDFLILNIDSSFSYQITDKKIYAKGTWAINNDLLSLAYSQPNDTLRFYNFKKTNNQLILSGKQRLYFLKYCSSRNK